MSRIPSSTQHTFARVPSADIPRSSFRRNSTYKTTFNAGHLIPFFLDEVLPGDTFNLSVTSFARILSPLKYPILDNLYLDYQFFFIPTRLVYDEYEEFFGSSSGNEGSWSYDDSHLMPGLTAPAAGFAVGSLADYFGLPVGVGNIRVNALPFRAYNLVVCEWYRPSSYMLAQPTIKTDSEDDNPAIYKIQKRMKRADYFTSALPSPQRGPGVDLNLAGYAPVVVRSEVITGSAQNTVRFKNMAGTLYPTSGYRDLYTSGGYLKSVPLSVAPGTDVDDMVPANLWADLGNGNSLSINDFRAAFQLQRALERDMRGGVRYVSQLLSHFGVRSPDARLQRTEFLGSGSTPIQIHTVANTSGGDTAQASLAAFGLSGSNQHGFVKSFTEHGYVLGLVSARADLTYQQGIQRMFDRFARFDHYYPVFAHLGEQVVKNQEIYAQDPTSSGGAYNQKPFAYQERYAEYRFSVNKITGQLRSQYEQSLDSWHLAQEFTALPTLNSQFLMENVPMSRVKAITTAPDFLFDCLINLNCVRPMPLFGVPGMVDHW